MQQRRGQRAPAEPRPGDGQDRRQASAVGDPAAGDQDLALLLYFVIVLPGIVIHELSHWLAAALLGICSLFSLVGLIHSVHPDGSLYLPWQVEAVLPGRIATGYALLALMALLLHPLTRAAENEQT